MVVLSILVFSLALAAATGAIAGTVIPRWPEIVDLLRFGPVIEQARPALARRSGRPISVSVRPRPAATLRAAA